MDCLCKIVNGNSMGYSWNAEFYQWYRLHSEAVTQPCYVRPATLLKRDSGTGVFLWILRNL